MSDAGEFSISSEEKPFLDEIRANPDDDGARLVYADWLEERGDRRCEYIRAEVVFHETSAEDDDFEKRRELLRDLQLDHDPDWTLRLARTDIENCPIEFEYACPKKWESLSPTTDAGVRVCGECRRSVYYCGTIAEAALRTFRGECIAFDASLAGLHLFDESSLSMGMGSPASVERALKKDLKREQRAAATRRRKRRKRE